MIGQGLAGPLAGDQDPATGVAEVVAVVGLALARAGDQAWPSFQPVRVTQTATVVRASTASDASRLPAAGRPALTR